MIAAVAVYLLRTYLRPYFLVVSQILGYKFGVIFQLQRLCKTVHADWTGSVLLRTALYSFFLAVDGEPLSACL